MRRLSASPDRSLVNVICPLNFPISSPIEVFSIKIRFLLSRPSWLLLSDPHTQFVIRTSLTGLQATVIAVCVPQASQWKSLLVPSENQHGKTNTPISSQLGVQAHTPHDPINEPLRPSPPSISSQRLTYHSVHFSEEINLQQYDIVIHRRCNDVDHLLAHFPSRSKSLHQHPQYHYISSTPIGILLKAC